MDHLQGIPNEVLKRGHASRVAVFPQNRKTRKGDFTRFPGPDYLPNKLPPMTDSECVEWARLNYRPGDPIPDSWWSVVRATCEEMNYEHRCRGYKKDYPPPKKIGKKPKKIDAFKEGARKVWDNKPLRRRWGLALGAMLILWGCTSLIYPEAFSKRSDETWSESKIAKTDSSGLRARTFADMRVLPNK